MNPKAETVEDLQSRRKRLHIGMCKLAREDLGLTVRQMEAEFTVGPLPNPPLPHLHIGS